MDRNSEWKNNVRILGVVEELDDMSNYIESNKLSCYNASMLRIRQFE